MEIQYRRKPRLDKKTWEALAKDYNGGMKLEELKSKYAISKSQIYYILSKLRDK